MKHQIWSTSIKSGTIITQVEITEKSSRTEYVFKTFNNPIFSLAVDNHEAIFGSKSAFYNLLEDLDLNFTNSSTQTVIVEGVDLRNRFADNSRGQGSHKNFMIIVNSYVLIVHSKNEPEIMYLV